MYIYRNIVFLLSALFLTFNALSALLLVLVELQQHMDLEPGLLRANNGTRTAVHLRSVCGRYVRSDGVEFDIMM